MTEKTLYAFVRQDCLEKGVNPGGWIPNQKVVPAFDPELKPVELVRKAFGNGNERVLVEIIGDAVHWFEERQTGPQKMFQGIYACDKPIPADYIKVVKE